MVASFSSTVVSTGFGVPDEIRLSDERYNYFDAELKFNNAISTWTSPTVISLLSYELILHDLKNPKTAFRRLTEKQLETDWYKQIKIDSAIKIFEETGAQPDLENRAYIIGRLLKPEARKDVIEYFSANNIIPTSMMDISDGLSSDMLHICKQSNVGCVLYEDKLPVNEDSKDFAYKLELDPTACALSGGEDYEMLFTISQADHDKIAANNGLSIIGYITEAREGKTIITRGGNKHELVAQGWNHLK